MLVGVAEIVETESVVLCTGPPLLERSITLRDPNACAPPPIVEICMPVTAAMPLPLFPSGSTATAIGLCTVAQVNTVGVAWVISNAEMVFDPVFTTSAWPVSGLMATPFGDVPTVGVAVTAAVSRLMTEAVPDVLLDTTANPSLESSATATGAEPTAIVFVTVPKVESGRRLMKETLLQPVFATTAMLRTLSIATPAGDGDDVVPGQSWLKSTSCTTKKSVALERTPLLTTSSA